MPTASTPAVPRDEYRFEHFVVRLPERTLYVGDEAAKLGSRAFDLLVGLIERRDRVVSKNELLDLVWPALIVEENNLQVHVSALRKLLGPHTIATVPGRGYRFAAQLTERQTPTDAAPVSAPPPAAAPTPISAETPAQQGNLGAAISPVLFGRDDDIRAVSALVRERQLVTLVGAGGIGKTQLALACARALAASGAFADGVWFVDLTPVTDAERMTAALVQTLGLTLPGLDEPVREIASALAAKRLLLVLDNCEHQLAAAGTIVSALCEQAVGLHALCTSRELLRLGGEQVYRVAALALPDATTTPDAASSAALALFIARMQTAQPASPLNDAAVAEIADICRALDGLPLAIELAAARVPLLGLTGVRDRLKERFRLLSGGARSAPQRHQTLRETLDWSYALLSQDERIVLQRASVFVGGFSLDAAGPALRGDDLDEWVVLDALGALVDKSLVTVTAADPPRYSLLESTRAYAFEKLSTAGAVPAARQQHARATLALFETAYESSWSEGQDERRARYLPDIDNLRTALDWASEHDAELSVLLAGAASWIWVSTWQIREGLARTGRALAQVDSHTSAGAEARLLMEWATLAHPRTGEAERRAIDRAVTLFRQIGNRKRLYRALRRQTIIAAITGRFDDAQHACDEMHAVFDLSWPDKSRWFLLSARLILAHHLQRHTEAAHVGHEALAVAKRSGDAALMRNTLDLLAQSARVRGDFAAAIAHERERVQAIRESPVPAALGLALGNLSAALLALSQLDEALEIARESVPLCLADGMLWTQLDTLSLLSLRRGRATEAALIVGRAIAVEAEHAGRHDPGSRHARDEVMAELQRQFSPGDLAAYLADGAKLSDERAATLAVSEQQRGRPLRQPAA